jgi:hypothetical protein
MFSDPVECCGFGRVFGKGLILSQGSADPVTLSIVSNIPTNTQMSSIAEIATAKRDQTMADNAAAGAHPGGRTTVNTEAAKVATPSGGFPKGGETVKGYEKK